MVRVRGGFGCLVALVAVVLSFASPIRAHQVTAEEREEADLFVLGNTVFILYHDHLHGALLPRSNAEKLLLYPVAFWTMTPPTPTGAGKLRPGDPPIDVNTAPVSELMRLPGVGPVLAERIADHRGREPFRAPDDLRKVKGIGPKTMEAIRRT